MENNKESVKWLIQSEYYTKIGGTITPDDFIAMATGICESESPLSEIDYYDILGIMSGADRLDASSGITTPECMAESTSDIFNRIVSFHTGEKVAKLLINININRSGDLKMHHVTSLNNFMSELPADVDLIWNISFDDNLTKKEVRVNVIINFKM